MSDMIHTKSSSSSTSSRTGSPATEPSSYGVISIKDTHVEKSLINEDSYPCFIREVGALRLLHKAKVPYIVALLDIIDNSTLCLEKYNGDLFDHPPTSEFLTEITYRILTTLVNMNLLHLSHRDIKPDNILSAGNKIALCDFGLSRYFSEALIPEQITGSVQTTQYRAPEIMFPEHNFQINPRNMDVWSLGITLLYLLDDMEDFILPLLTICTELTMEELFDIYEQHFEMGGLLDTQIESDTEMELESVQLLKVIRQMLIIDPKDRPDPSTLLSDSIFDTYRSQGDIIDAESFNYTRIQHVLDYLPTTTSEALGIDDDLNCIKHFEYNNQESKDLAIILYFMYKEKSGIPIASALSDDQIIAIICIACSVFDSDIIDIEDTVETSRILRILDYDVLWPVNATAIQLRLSMTH